MEVSAGGGGGGRGGASLGGGACCMRGVVVVITFLSVDDVTGGVGGGGGAAFDSTGLCRCPMSIHFCRVHKVHTLGFMLHSCCTMKHYMLKYVGITRFSLTQVSVCITVGWKSYTFIPI